MKKHRKTEAERREERAASETRCWEEFRPKLEAAQTYADTINLHSEAPPPDAPGRRYYSNLGFFLQGFTPPQGANLTERANYLRLIKNFDAAGMLKPGARQQVEEAFRKAPGVEMS